MIRTKFLTARELNSDFGRPITRASRGFSATGERRMHEWLLIAGELNDGANETMMDTAAASDNHGL